jgi:hypothetical protein
MVALGEGAVSYERGTPVIPMPHGSYTPIASTQAAVQWHLDLPENAPP